MPVIPALERLRKEKHKLLVSYIGDFKPAWAMERDLPTEQQQQQQQQHTHGVGRRRRNTT